MVDATELIKLNQSTDEKSLKLATVVQLFESGTVKIKFYGEDSPSEKEFSYLASYTPEKDDTILLIPMADTYIVLGKILYGVVIHGIGYVTADQLNSALEAYAKSSDLTIYMKTEELTETLKAYVKTTDLTSYVTKTLLSNTLSGYAQASHNHSEIINPTYSQYGADVAKQLNGTPYFSPSVNNVMACGSPNYKWSTVYASTATINTSDKEQKEQIRDITISEKNVAVKIKKLLKVFKFKDSVFLKGENARIHTGAIAQDVKEAFESEGLNPYEYALFCSDTWYEVDGKLRNEEEKEYTAEDIGAVGVTQLGLRYEELLCFVIAAI